MSFQNFDRSFLTKAYTLAHAARKAPARIGLPLEPTWGALLATPTKELASEVFVPGDTMDAVQALRQCLEPSALAQADLTLYLTIEPFSTYERLPPVTESIRALGVKRVVIGAENPWNRARGKGIASLSMMGVRVVRSDGEIARQCQLLYEDYAKAMARSLPVLRLVWELDNQAETVGKLGFSVAKRAGTSFQYDAILWSDVAAAKKYTGDSWVVVLDAKQEVDSLKDFASSRVIIFQGKARQPEFYEAPEWEDGLDLAFTLRKLRDLGILSVLCRGDEALFQRALESGLVDSVLSFVTRKNRPVAGILSQLSQSFVQGDHWACSLLSPRILQEEADSILIETGVKIQ